MALYLGDSCQLKLYLNNILYRLNILYKTSDNTGVGYLKSSDGYILTDINGFYILPSDYGEPFAVRTLLSSDDYILTDLNKTYLTYKEDE